MNTVLEKSTVDVATLPARLLELAHTRGDTVGLRWKTVGRWQSFSWRSYALRVAGVAAGLRELGVTRGGRVAILAENRPEWVFADLAVQGLGAVSVGIYPTSPPADVEYILAHAQVEIAIVENEEQLDKVLAVRGRLPVLRHIVVMDGRGVRPGDAIPFMDLERDEALDEFAASVSLLDPSSLAVLVYTSGTTGPPKGAMLSHANLLASGHTFAAALPAGPRDEILSYLPLCHVAERLLSVIVALSAGSTVNFGEGFLTDLHEVQPTIFLGVPRVWEKMMAGVEIRIADSTWLKKTLYRLCVRLGKRIAPRRMTGRASVFDRLVLTLCGLLVFRPLRAKLGMSRARVPLSGAAPIAPQVLEFLWAIGIPVREGYGQTENTAICTLNPPGDVRLGTVGQALPGVEVRIADDGEILTRSAGVFLGYLNDPGSGVDADGWLHTGDVGALEDGYLRITDRKKDVIITAGGKNLSPSEIENRLKVSPYVREAVVIGDRRNYVTALIGIELETVGDWAARRDLPYTTYADLAGKPEVVALIQTVVRAANRDLAQVAQVKRFTLLDKELDHEDGELTATQKVKRAAIERRFATRIEAMYT
ncbi:AMP-dependent synthetase/ligase [Actinocrispum wychmicini]|uniref:Acyl-CoA synthetase n=1 Tax=Actinocrispum wychmicini TaxID=1213861 RepID=A0A4R2JZ41_9PSEU|nr:AMP-binding protein [Actinocrispum wychmicini]TCO64552.1 long-chain acyl-CoA synthetase [Actinocrispum wychmicini]